MSVGILGNHTLLTDGNKGGWWKDLTQRLESREFGFYTCFLFLSLSFGMCFCAGLFLGICNQHLDVSGISGLHRVCHICRHRSVGTLWFGGMCAIAMVQVWVPSQVCWCFQVHLAWNLCLFWLYLWHNYETNRKMASYCSKWLDYRKSLKHHTFLKTPILLSWLAFFSPAFTMWQAADSRMGKSREFGITKLLTCSYLYHQEGAYLITFPLRSNPAHTHTRVFKYVQKLFSNPFELSFLSPQLASFPCLG